MLDMIKLTIGIVAVTVLVLAIPVFAWVLGCGLALVVLFFLINEYKEAENVKQKEKL